MSGNTSKRYPVELKQRAVRMYGEVRADHVSDWAAMVKVATLLGISTAETLPKRIRQAEVGQGNRPWTTTEEAAELKKLKREDAELRRADAMLGASYRRETSSRPRSGDRCLMGVSGPTRPTDSKGGEEAGEEGIFRIEQGWVGIRWRQLRTAAPEVRGWQCLRRIREGQPIRRYLSDVQVG